MAKGSFNVNLNKPAPVGGLNIGLTYEGTAVLGVDYSAPSSITIPEGQTNAIVDIIPIDDSIVEGTETINVIVTPAANGEYASNGSAISITLYDND